MLKKILIPEKESSNLTGLFSGIGTVAGGIAGSVVPGVGTLAGAGLGGLLGGVAGKVTDGVRNSGGSPTEVPYSEENSISRRLQKQGPGALDYAGDALSLTRGVASISGGGSPQDTPSYQSPQYTFMDKKLKF